MTIDMIMCKSAMLLLPFQHHLLLLFLLLPPISVSTAQPRFLHGQSSENPMAFPPSAREFFRSHASPPALPAPMKSPQGLQSSSEAARLGHLRGAEESSAATRVGGAAGETAVFLGLISVMLVAMGAFYVVARQRSLARCQQRTLLKEGGLARDSS